MAFASTWRALYESEFVRSTATPSASAAGSNGFTYTSTYDGSYQSQWVIDTANNTFYLQIDRGAGYATLPDDHGFGLGIFNHNLLAAILPTIEVQESASAASGYATLVTVDAQEGDFVWAFTGDLSERYLRIQFNDTGSFSTDAEIGQVIFGHLVDLTDSGDTASPVTGLSQARQYNSVASQSAAGGHVGISRPARWIDTEARFEGITSTLRDKLIDVEHWQRGGLRPFGLVGFTDDWATSGLGGDSGDTWDIAGGGSAWLVNLGPVVNETPVTDGIWDRSWTLRRQMGSDDT